MKRKDFIDSMHCQLLQRRNELLDGVSGENNLLNGLGISTDPGDAADLASEAVEGEISAQLADVEFREIANIDKALRRVADGSYGICVACHKNIPVSRLEAIPHAGVCIECKRIAEEHGIDEESTTDWSTIPGFDSTIDPDASVS